MLSLGSRQEMDWNPWRKRVNLEGRAGTSGLFFPPRPALFPTTASQRPGLQPAQVMFLACLARPRFCRPLPHISHPLPSPLSPFPSPSSCGLIDSRYLTNHHHRRRRRRHRCCFWPSFLLLCHPSPHFAFCLLVHMPPCTISLMHTIPLRKFLSVSPSNYFYLHCDLDASGQFFQDLLSLY